MDRRRFMKGILGFIAGLLGITKTVEAGNSPIKSNDLPPDSPSDFPKGTVDTVHIFYSEERSEFVLTMSFYKWEKATERDISAGKYISSKGEVFKIHDSDFQIKTLFFNGEEFYYRSDDRKHLLGHKTEELCGILSLENRKNWLFKRRGDLVDIKTGKYKKGKL